MRRMFTCDSLLSAMCRTVPHFLAVQRVGENNNVSTRVCCSHCPLTRPRFSFPGVAFSQMMLIVIPTQPLQRDNATLKWLPWLHNASAEATKFYHYKKCFRDSNLVRQLKIITLCGSRPSSDDARLTQVATAMETLYVLSRASQVFVDLSSMAPVRIAKGELEHRRHCPAKCRFGLGTFLLVSITFVLESKKVCA